MGERGEMGEIGERGRDGEREREGERGGEGERIENNPEVIVIVQYVTACVTSRLQE